MELEQQLGGLFSLLTVEFLIPYLNRTLLVLTRTNQLPKLPKDMVKVWEEYLDETRKKGSSLGAKLLINARNVPAGLGEPVYGKLDADIASALMSINAVKGIEIGAGFDSAKKRKITMYTTLA